MRYAINVKNCRHRYRNQFHSYGPRRGPPDFTYKILDRFKDMARLGNGSFATQRLSDEAIARGLSVIGHLVTLAKNKGYDRIIAVATSAVREAKNGGDFIDLVAEQTGSPFGSSAATEEARLIFLGIKNSVPMTEQPALARRCRRWIGRTHGRQS